MSAAVLSRLARRARELYSGAATALIVPASGVPVSPSPGGGLPPHVTVLHPFLGARHAGPRLSRELVEVFGAVPAFDFALTAVARFPGVLYLAPEPSAPFVVLTKLCTGRWPDHPPYRGAYDEIIPHLTVAEGPEPPGLADRLAAELPLRARAEELWLMAPVRRSGWRRAATVRLRDSRPDREG